MLVYSINDLVSIQTTHTTKLPTAVWHYAGVNIIQIASNKYCSFLAKKYHRQNEYSINNRMVEGQLCLFVTPQWIESDKHKPPEHYITNKTQKDNLRAQWQKTPPNQKSFSTLMLREEYWDSRICYLNLHTLQFTGLTPDPKYHHFFPCYFFQLFHRRKLNSQQQKIEKQESKHRRHQIQII